MTFISDEVVYIYAVPSRSDGSFYSYDITTKTFEKSVSLVDEDKYIDPMSTGFSTFFLDGNFYVTSSGLVRSDSDSLEKYDLNGNILASFQSDYDEFYSSDFFFFFDKGILAVTASTSNYVGSVVLLSYDLEKIADIPFPQYEIEHGMKKDCEMDLVNTFVADGTVYTQFFRYDDYACYFCRLNTDTYEWDNLGEHGTYYITGSDFFGKYFSTNDGIYDRVTREQVFAYRDQHDTEKVRNIRMYHPVCYFGGDKYLGCKSNEYRWINLSDMTISDPLPFPKEERIAILDDTYCVYFDEYGWFLWNYNTGEEETIYMFDN